PVYMPAVMKGASAQALVACWARATCAPPAARYAAAAATRSAGLEERRCVIMLDVLVLGASGPNGDRARFRTWASDFRRRRGAHGTTRTGVDERAAGRIE